MRQCFSSLLAMLVMSFALQNHLQAQVFIGFGGGGFGGGGVSIGLGGFGLGGGFGGLPFGGGFIQDNFNNYGYNGNLGGYNPAVYNNLGRPFLSNGGHFAEGFYGNGNFGGQHFNPVVIGRGGVPVTIPTYRVPVTGFNNPYSGGGRRIYTRNIYPPYYQDHQRQQYRPW